MLSTFLLLEAFSTIAYCPPSYRNAVFIQRQWSLHSTAMESSFNLKEADILIGRVLSSSFRPHLPPLKRSFRLLFHEFPLSCLFTFCQENFQTLCGYRNPNKQGKQPLGAACCIVLFSFHQLDLPLHLLGRGQELSELVGSDTNGQIGRAHV